MTHYAPWKIGDEIEVSENQKLLMREPRSFSIFDPIRIPSCSRESLIQAFRNFMNMHPVLCIKLKKKNSKFFQEYIPANEVKLGLAYRKISQDEPFEDLVKEAYLFLKRPCKFFDGELIRLAAYLDECNNEVHLGIGIHYVLIDMYTRIILANNLSALFNKKTFQTNHVHYFEFVSWQKKFLSSEEGREQRNFWVGLLKKALLKTPGLTRRPDRLVALGKSFVSQKMILRNDDLQMIRQTSKGLNLPLSALFISTHQSLINSLVKERRYLQLVRVDGREEAFKELEIKHLLGMVSNTLPLPLISEEDKSMREFITEVYIEYCNARLHQHVPYEIIRKDFQDTCQIDIDTALIGLFNFIILNSEKRFDPRKRPLEDFVIERKELDSGEFINFYTKLYIDALEIEFICPRHLYEENKAELNLKQFIQNRFLMPLKMII